MNLSTCKVKAWSSRYDIWWGEKIALAHAGLPEHQTLESMMQGPCALAGTCYWELFRNTWLAWRQVQCIAAPGQARVPDGHPISFFIYFARSLKQASIHPAPFVTLLRTCIGVCWSEKVGLWPWNNPTIYPLHLGSMKKITTGCLLGQE